MSKNLFSPYEMNLIHKVGGNLDQLARFRQQNPDKPLEYLLGKAQFLDMLLEVSADTLIPRVESDELVERAVEALLEKLAQKLDSTSNLSILDMGCGSGALGIGAARLIKQKLQNHKNLTQPLQIEVWLVDVSEKAVAIAEKNADEYLTAKNSDASMQKVTFESFCKTSNLWENIPSEKKFELILANLPYIPDVRIPYLENSVKDFEPHVALDGGENGLELIHKFLKLLPNHAATINETWLEIDHTHGISDLKVVPEQAHFVHHKDTFGQPRFMQITFDR